MSEHAELIIALKELAATLWGSSAGVAIAKAITALEAGDKPRELAGVKWLDTLEPGDVFDFMGERFYAMLDINNILVLSPTNRFDDHAYRDNGRWEDLDVCFRKHDLARLSAKTVTIHTLPPLAKEAP